VVQKKHIPVVALFDQASQTGIAVQHLFGMASCACPDNAYPLQNYVTVNLIAAQAMEYQDCLAHCISAPLLMPRALKVFVLPACR